MVIIPSRKISAIVKRLLTIAKQADCGFKLACGAAKNGKLISAYMNSNKTHTIAKNTRVNALHAEMGLAKALGDLNLYQVIVTRWRPTGPGLAKPCEFCNDVLKKFNCKSVLYTVSQTWEEFTFNPILGQYFII